MTKRTIYRGFIIERNGRDAFSVLVPRGDRKWVATMADAKALVDAVRLERTLQLMERS